tara:strand:- start:37267 stop:37572 length:306 start_codon:yes stop_codon:yes gene_type:complete
MADTINNIILNAQGWQDMNVATGIPAGTEIVIQNQTNKHIYAYLGNTSPANTPRPERKEIPDGSEGYILIPPFPAINERIVTAGENTVWLFGNGPINIQER